MYKKKHWYQLPTEDFKGQRAIKSKKKKQQKNQVLSLPPSWVQIGVLNDIFEEGDIILISLAILERYSFVRNCIRHNFYEK